jgi:isoquinoline 1-oxidoreductase beta subunit
VPVMFWRSVGSSQNAFFVEGYIDELAHAAGHDAYKFRRALLAHRPDFLGVLDKIAEKSDWGKPLQPAAAVASRSSNLTTPSSVRSPK